MKSEISPVAAVVVIVVVVVAVVIGGFMWFQKQAPTFSKSEARGRMDMPIGRSSGK